MEKNDCNQDYQVCNYNSTTYDYRVHDNVIISGTTCYSVLNGILNEQVIDAKTGILIQNDTEINSESLFRIIPCEAPLNFPHNNTTFPPQQWLNEHNPR